MKCLSIQQPWAQYIATGIKDVENRSWGLKNFPQRVLIHTGKKMRTFSPDELPLLWGFVCVPIFEYPDISEDNLPECLEIPKIHREGEELFIPLHPETIDNIIETTEDEIAFGHNLLEGNFDFFATYDSDEAKTIPTSHITFFSDDKKVRLKVIEAEIIQMTDDKDNPVEFGNPQGDLLYWVRIGYKLVKE